MVFYTNSEVNNYFDGPFDQLPDNFMEGEAFREMLLKVEPSLGRPLKNATGDS